MLGFQGAAHVRQAVTHALYSTADVLRLCTRSRGSTFIEKRGGWSFFILTLFALFCRETGDTGIVLHFGRSPHSYLLFFLLCFCFVTQRKFLCSVLFCSDWGMRRVRTSALALIWVVWLVRTPRIPLQTLYRTSTSIKAPGHLI